ncbi:hypothetical protein ABEB36_006111 [Hypothenemus hampei]|uniref:Elongator complex protein 4 n=1 Tax=Hypothenemus hampei TaxID=57062 RepID=A0ABD1F159_HYPHA
MEKRNNNLLPGTILSTHNGRLLISSGVTSLDSLLGTYITISLQFPFKLGTYIISGGGIPVGSVVLVEEDFRGLHSKVLLKYFLAEGLISKHSVLIASQDVNPYIIVKELPAVIETDPEPDNINKGPTVSDKMKIAFRYQNLLSNDDLSKTRNIAHHFDLSKNISLGDIENLDINYWTGQRIETGLNTFINPAYNDLLKSIKNKIKDGKFFLKDNPEKKTVLRIGIHSLGSPMWLPCKKSTYSIKDNSQDLHKFLFCLRTLIRSAHAVAFVTIPSYLYDEESLDRCIHCSDVAIKLQSFSGTDLEHNQSLKDYQGFFYLTKLGAINSLISKHPGSIEFVFKLKRKKFLIDVLHLPPDIGDNLYQRNDSTSLSCGGSNRRLLEF